MSKVIEIEWTDVSFRKPIKWDLVIVKDDKGREQAGWWTGSYWDFGKKHIEGEVVLWRRKREQIIRGEKNKRKKRK